MANMRVKQGVSWWFFPYIRLVCWVYAVRGRELSDQQLEQRVMRHLNPSPYKRRRHQVILSKLRLKG
ncbi:hypothetical protein CYR40_09170 [Chimaeribacter arupi]|uniref:Transposase n=1 Tax=Nissabacter archeti TaxID=1917880 RepID=A0ABS5JBT8_9GAMM|nr:MULTISPECIES: hypothetical protein [Yersiniaceae]MBS0967425.1 hypothetical protein [Nissabacter archeti]MDV5141516.1 hypothetical protein [Chimaeribacter arupi]PLR34573.1 hypothetical protein CYR23_10495 [Chimaeribacter arupi]PLR47291.1 hypothetical protein CYR40_09170 [Chimaeribacter arupi]WKZ93858.1 hypothetical protein P0E69_08235 [Chimaeribacter arupi]